MPKKAKPAKDRPLYKSPPPKPVTSDKWRVTSKTESVGRASPRAETPHSEFHNPHFLPPAHFELKEDGTIETAKHAIHAKSDSPLASSAYLAVNTPRLVFNSEKPFLRLYHGNCLELLDAIAAKYPEGRFDAIFADPPYFLSNGGITCHAGQHGEGGQGRLGQIARPGTEPRVQPANGSARCQRVLKPNGTLWVTGTHHVIFSIGYALQQLGYKILNDIAWEKPNPPPNLSCRYFTHSTETILWAAQEREEQARLQLPGNAQSDRETDENRLAGQRV